MRVLRRRLSPLSTYVVLAFACSWIPWAPVVLLLPDVGDPPPWALVVAFVGVYGPSLAAIATAAIHGGPNELRALFARLWRWRVAWWWYTVVLLGPPAFVWLGAGIHLMLGGNASAAGMRWPISAALILVTFIPFGPLGEELGWRGYALARLETRLRPLASSLTLGIIWAAWHAPMFWFPPIGLPARSLGTVGMWTANVLSSSILLSYAARRTNYSVPIAILLHATLNAGSAMGFSALVATSSDSDAIRSFASLVRWTVVLAAALMLGRERPDQPSSSPRGGALAA